MIDKEFAIGILEQYREKPTLINEINTVEEMVWFNEALEMGIEALKQGPILDKIRAEIRKWYWQADKQAIAKDPCVVDAMIDLFIRTIDKYKTENEG